MGKLEDKMERTKSNREDEIAKIKGKLEDQVNKDRKDLKAANSEIDLMKKKLDRTSMELRRKGSTTEFRGHSSFMSGSLGASAGQEIKQTMDLIQRFTVLEAAHLQVTTELTDTKFLLAQKEEELRLLKRQFDRKREIWRARKEEMAEELQVVKEGLDPTFDEFSSLDITDATHELEIRRLLLDQMEEQKSKLESELAAARAEYEQFTRELQQAKTKEEQVKIEKLRENSGNKVKDLTKELKQVTKEKDKVEKKMEKLQMKSDKLKENREQELSKNQSKIIGRICQAL